MKWSELEPTQVKGSQLRFLNGGVHSGEVDCQKEDEMINKKHLHEQDLEKLRNTTAGPHSKGRTSDVDDSAILQRRVN